MTNPKRVVIVLAVIALIVGVVWGIGGGNGPWNISGYSGIEASVYSIDHTYDADNTNIDLRLTSAEIYPEYTTGLHIEVSQPMIADYEDDYNKAVSVHDGDKNVTTTWKAQIVHLQMSAMMRTAGYQMPEINNVVFNIRLKQNDNSFFQGANSSYAAIISVRTSQVVEVGPTGAIFQVDPASANFEVDLTSLKTLPVPQWVIDSGYQKVIGDYADLTFPIRVIRAAPLGVIQQFRTEAQAGMRFEIDALLFGEWVATKPWRETGFPDVSAWWDVLLGAIGEFIALIVGVILTVFIFVRVKKPRFAILAVIILWAVVAFYLGWLAPYLGGLTGG